MTPPFYKLFYKNNDVYKNYIFGRIASNFVHLKFFGLSLNFSKRISKLGKASKKILIFLHVAKTFTYLQVIYSNRLLPWRPPLGATESDTPLERGVNMAWMLSNVSRLLNWVVIWYSGLQELSDDIELFKNGWNALNQFYCCSCFIKLLSLYKQQGFPKLMYPNISASLASRGGHS